MKVKWYRPKRKDDLVHHLNAHSEVSKLIEPQRWTVQALHELHDGLHRERVVSNA